jgi:REP element-mobilizing transposase RayT
VRPALAAHQPVHVITRVLGALAPLRRRDAYRAIRRALRTSLARSDFRIVRLVVRSARLELLVEADDKAALARGMQGFQVAAARRLNTALSRSGRVFPDRYRSSILRTRHAVRAAIAELPPAHEPSVVATPTWPLTWMLRVELLGRIRPRPRRGARLVPTQAV